MNTRMNELKHQVWVWLRKYPSLYRLAIDISHRKVHPWRGIRGLALTLTGGSGYLRVGESLMEIPHDWWSVFSDGDFYEKNVSYWLEQLLVGSTNRVLYDIGANYGYYCLKLAKSASHIYAFEPVERTYQTLLRNIERNQLTNVTPYRLGLSDHCERAEIHLYTTSAYNSLFEIDYPSVCGQEEAIIGKEAISLVTLDELIREQRLQQPDVMKMDIEGGELFALKGARKTITTAHPLLVLEFNPRTYQAAGYKPTDILVELEAYDYHIYGLSQDARDFTIYPARSFPGKDIANVLAVPRQMEGLLSGHVCTTQGI